MLEVTIQQKQPDMVFKASEGEAEPVHLAFVMHLRERLAASQNKALLFGAVTRVEFQVLDQALTIYQNQLGVTVQARQAGAIRGPVQDGRIHVGEVVAEAIERHLGRFPGFIDHETLAPSEAYAQAVERAGREIQLLRAEKGNGSSNGTIPVGGSALSKLKKLTNRCRDVLDSDVDHRSAQYKLAREVVGALEDIFGGAVER